MKTTVELPDGLREAKRVALREKTTVRALIERGLRIAIGGRPPTGKRFTLRDASVGGEGLVAGRSLRDWETIRDLIYSERGA